MPLDTSTGRVEAGDVAMDKTETRPFQLRLVLQSRASSSNDGKSNAKMQYQMQMSAIGSHPSNLDERGLAHSNCFDSTLRNIYHEHAYLGGQLSFGCWDEIVDDGLNVSKDESFTANEMRDM